MSEVATTTDSSTHPALGHDAWETEIAKIQRPALIVGVAGLVLTLIGLIVAPHSGFKSYLWAFMYWSLIPLGSLGFLMIQHMTGGYWGLAIRRILEASASLVPLTAIFGIPLLFLVIFKKEWFWPWVNGSPENHFRGMGEYANPAHMNFKSWYLSPGMWILRAIIYFVIWTFLALYLYSWSGREDRVGSTDKSRFAARRVSAPGLLIFTLCGTFAMFDWVMSLDPSWYSTMFGVLYIIGQALASIAFTIVILRLVAGREPLRGILSPIILNDIGNLMFAFTLFWAYVNFSQLVIMWSGNLPAEASYYYVRSSKGWTALSIFIAVFQFFVPFTILLWRKVKRDIKLLAMVAMLILVMRAVDTFWVIKPMWIERQFTLQMAPEKGGSEQQRDEKLVTPELRPDEQRTSDAHPPADTHNLVDSERGHPVLAEMYPYHHVEVQGVWAGGWNWTDIPALAGLGGIWLAAFSWRLRQRPLVPPNDPRLAELAEAAHH